VWCINYTNRQCGACNDIYRLEGGTDGLNTHLQRSYSKHEAAESCSSSSPAYFAASLIFIVSYCTYAFIQVV